MMCMEWRSICVILNFFVTTVVQSLNVTKKENSMNVDYFDRRCVGRKGYATEKEFQLILKMLPDASSKAVINNLSNNSREGK